ATFNCSATATPPPADTTAPTISSISVTNITPSTASINWLTSEPADSQVEFVSPCPSNGCFTPIVATLSTSRSVDVANLAGSITYTYRVRSKDAAGNTAVSANQTFTTSAAPVLPPTGPPSVPSSIAAVCNGATQVTLSWPAVSTATAYYLRINDLANASSTPYDYMLDGLEATSFTA